MIERTVPPWPFLSVGHVRKTGGAQAIAAAGAAVSFQTVNRLIGDIEWVSASNAFRLPNDRAYRASAQLVWLPATASAKLLEFELSTDNGTTWQKVGIGTIPVSTIYQLEHQLLDPFLTSAASYLLRVFANPSGVASTVANQGTGIPVFTYFAVRDVYLGNFGSTS